MESLPRVVVLVAIVATGCIISYIVSTKLSSPGHNLRPDQRIRNRRGLFVLQAGPGGFQDPKTVELRPNVNNLLQSDAPGNTRVVSPQGVQGTLNDIIATADDANANILEEDAGGGITIAAETIATPVKPYNIDNALLTVNAFRYQLFFFVYDSATDKFVVVHNVKGCDRGCARIFRVASITALALRKHFPARFKGPESDDFVVMMSTGDAPRMHQRCLLFAPDYCESADFAPILQFGSVFTDTNIFPSMIAMPLPVRPHIPCFDEWQVTGGTHVCQDLQPKIDITDNEISSGMIFGDQLGLVDPDGKYWDKLVPQVVWRGSDFMFLHTMFPKMRRPEFKLDIEPKQQSFPQNGSPEEDRRWAIQTLWDMGDEQLLPRWRGVLLTSEAESEAREYEEVIGDPKLPWVNIKFASIAVAREKIPASECEEYKLLEKMGIAAIGDYVNITTQAQYKYHIDLGGGGGTTWTGTIEKLALPGLLFHHLTPTKDWFHDLLVPWQHYVPVQTDLSDLRSKFEWAESHPLQARHIAEQGTQFARWMGSVDGFRRLYDENLVAPLRDVMRAYRPLPPKYAGKSVLEVIMGSSDEFEIVSNCEGTTSNSCRDLLRSRSG
eukprot:CAMPEP_0183717658 /NCGR_PEP_ID=MMETSP0737-20130205/11210_1 /TAXON_ID=385413 /ORGANISM="Thalassiosira miniscula, Strain CCMP1093" /LENGTH=608 /DNA_ID=CAMNT_0025947135 /DNA_START=175 /DNA_END=2001 /DNA_ORIENTATION=+